MRIPAPSHTQTPNDLFDHWLPHLNESELKVLLVIIRKTFGWHKERDRISISQLQRLTGLSEPSVLGAVKSLISKGVIHKQTVGEIGKQQSFYELVVEESNNSYPPSKLGATPQDALGSPPPKMLGDTKETLSPKETTTKQTEPPYPLDPESPIVGSSVGSSDTKEVSVPSEDQETLRKKTEVFNHLCRLNCDVISATWFIETYSYEDLIAAAQYVARQQEKKRKNNGKIEDFIGYYRRTLEGKWWIPTPR